MHKESVAKKKFLRLLLPGPRRITNREPGPLKSFNRVLAGSANFRMNPGRSIGPAQQTIGLLIPDNLPGILVPG